MNDKYVTIKSDKKSLFFTIQIVLFLFLITIGGVALFIKDFVPYFYLLLSLNMIILIVNNSLFLKKKYINIAYAIIAVYTFIVFIKGIM